MDFSKIQLILLKPKQVKKNNWAHEKQEGSKVIQALNQWQKKEKNLCQEVSEVKREKINEVWSSCCLTRQQALKIPYDPKTNMKFNSLRGIQHFFLMVLVKEEKVCLI